MPWTPRRLHGFRQEAIGRILFDQALEHADAEIWGSLDANVRDGIEALHRLFRNAGFTPEPPDLGRLTGLFPELHHTS